MNPRYLSVKFFIVMVLISFDFSSLEAVLNNTDKELNLFKAQINPRGYGSIQYGVIEKNLKDVANRINELTDFAGLFPTITYINDMLDIYYAKKKKDQDFDGEGKIKEKVLALISRDKIEELVEKATSSEDLAKVKEIAKPLLEIDPYNKELIDLYNSIIVFARQRIGKLKKAEIFLSSLQKNIDDTSRGELSRADISDMSKKFAFVKKTYGKQAEENEGIKEVDKFLKQESIAKPQLNYLRRLIDQSQTKEDLLLVREKIKEVSNEFKGLSEFTSLQDAATKKLKNVVYKDLGEEGVEGVVSLKERKKKKVSFMTLISEDEEEYALNKQALIFSGYLNNRKTEKKITLNITSPALEALVHILNELPKQQLTDHKSYRKFVDTYTQYLENIVVGDTLTTKVKRIVYDWSIQRLFGKYTPSDKQYWRKILNKSVLIELGIAGMQLKVPLVYQSCARLFAKNIEFFFPNVRSWSSMFFGGASTRGIDFKRYVDKDSASISEAFKAEIAKQYFYLYGAHLFTEKPHVPTAGDLYKDYFLPEPMWGFDNPREHLTMLKDKQKRYTDKVKVSVWWENFSNDERTYQPINLDSFSLEEHNYMTKYLQSEIKKYQGKLENELRQLHRKKSTSKDLKTTRPLQSQEGVVFSSLDRIQELSELIRTIKNLYTTNVSIKDFSKKHSSLLKEERGSFYPEGTLQRLAEDYVVLNKKEEDKMKSENWRSKVKFLLGGKTMSKREKIAFLMNKVPQSKLAETYAKQVTLAAYLNKIPECPFKKAVLEASYDLVEEMGPSDVVTYFSQMERTDLARPVVKIGPSKMMAALIKKAEGAINFNSKNDGREVVNNAQGIYKLVAQWTYYQQHKESADNVRMDKIAKLITDAQDQEGLNLSNLFAKEIGLSISPDRVTVVNNLLHLVLSQVKEPIKTLSIDGNDLIRLPYALRYFDHLKSLTLGKKEFRGKDDKKFIQTLVDRGVTINH